MAKTSAQQRLAIVRSEAVRSTLSIAHHRPQSCESIQGPATQSTATANCVDQRYEDKTCFPRSCRPSPCPRAFTHPRVVSHLKIAFLAVPPTSRPALCRTAQLYVSSNPYVTKKGLPSCQMQDAAFRCLRLAVATSQNVSYTNIIWGFGMLSIHLCSPSSSSQVLPVLLNPLSPPHQARDAVPKMYTRVRARSRCPCRYRGLASTIRFEGVGLVVVVSRGHPGWWWWWWWASSALGGWQRRQSYHSHGISTMFREC